MKQTILPFNIATMQPELQVPQQHLYFNSLEYFTISGNSV